MTEVRNKSWTCNIFHCLRFPSELPFCGNALGSLLTCLWKRLAVYFGLASFPFLLLWACSPFQHLIATFPNKLCNPKEAIYRNTSNSAVTKQALSPSNRSFSPGKQSYVAVCLLVYSIALDAVFKQANDSKQHKSVRGSALQQNLAGNILWRLFQQNLEESQMWVQNLPIDKWCQMCVQRGPALMSIGWGSTIFMRVLSTPGIYPITEYKALMQPHALVSAGIKTYARTGVTHKSSLKATSPNILKFTTVAWSCKTSFLEHWLPQDTCTGCQFDRSKTLVFSILSEDYIKFNTGFSEKRGPLLCKFKIRATVETFASASL